MAKKANKRLVSAVIRVNEELEQAFSLRQPLISRIEELMGAGTTIVTLFMSFWAEESQMEDIDAEMLENVLASIDPPPKRLVLVINAPGGQATAAERIVNVCKSYSGGSFEVLVPHMAKSAATLVCFGASKIHISKTAELGPVDPQVFYRNEQNAVGWISADEYIRSYENLMDQATSGKAKRIEPLLQQLQRYDARYIEQLRSARDLSDKISVRLLKSSMMSGKSDEDIKRSIKMFLSQEETRNHGRMITFDEAKSCGLKVSMLELGTELWNAIWELYIRSNTTFRRKGKCKLIETSGSSFTGSA